MKPKALHVELNCVNDALRVGGTMDLICEIDGENHAGSEARLSG